MSALETSLTEPLLADGEEEFIGNINADSCRSSSRSRQAEDNNNPSSNAQAEEQKSDADGDGNTEQSPLQNPELEYEPSDYDDDENDDQAPIKMIKVRQPQTKEVLRTANVPVCVQCENCNTTCETTVVHVFGMSTCLWVCILLVLCFPVAWLPLFWKDVSSSFAFVLQLLW